MWKLIINTESDDRLCAILAVQSALAELVRDAHLIQPLVGSLSYDTSDGHKVKADWLLED